MKRKTLVAAIITIAMCFSIIAGATFALFTSESKVNVAVGAANVKVVATVENVVLGTTLKTNVPETSVNYTFDDTQNVLTIDKMVPGDYVTFDLRLKNESNVTVNYRTVIDLVEDKGLWNGLEVTIDGAIYDGLSTVKSNWGVLTPGIADTIVPVKVSLPQLAGNEYINTSCTFGYTIECVQGNVEVENAPNNANEFNELLSSGKDVALLEDVQSTKGETSQSNSYGTAGFSQLNGGTIDGNGNTLSYNGWDTWDSAINTTGGTIKNLTIDKGFRGIFVNHNSANASKVILENVIIDGPTYTISCDQGTNNGLEATNCTFNGWTSYAATIGEVVFENCHFGEGAGYAYMRPYAKTTFVNCTFEAGFVIDARADVSFENCTFDGVEITDANVASLVVYGASYATVVPKNN